MKNNKKTLAIIAAALLAVSPIATNIVSFPTTQNTVKAATQLSSDELMKPYYEQTTAENEDKDDFVLVKLIKANPYLTVYNGETVRNASKRRITDISSNFGHVSGKSRDHSFVIYKTYDNGRPDFDAPVKNSQKFHSGENYVALLSYDIENVNKDYDSCCMYQLDTDTDLVSIEFYEESSASLLVPVKVEPASAKPKSKNKTNKSKKKRAYVKVRKNHRVRTYTSRGKFSKHYVYGHKVTSKKHIKGHGACWKLSGKNQYVPAKYVKVR